MATKKERLVGKLEATLQATGVRVWHTTKQFNEGWWCWHPLTGGMFLGKTFGEAMGRAGRLPTAEKVNREIVQKLMKEME